MRYPAVLEGYKNANWIFDDKYLKFSSGFIFIVGGALISQKSSK